MEGRPGKQEKLDIEVRLATPEDAEVCRELRIEATLGSDRINFGVSDENIAKREKKEGERDWVSELSDPDKFTVLLYSGDKAVGLGRAQDEKDSWYLYSGYVKPEFRGGAGKKMFAYRLKEIQKRGGKKVYMGVKDFNNASIAIAEFFGFRKRTKNELKDVGLYMDLEDVNSPEVTTKINQILNEG